MARIYTYTHACNYYIKCKRFYTSHVLKIQYVSINFLQPILYIHCVAVVTLIWLVIPHHTERRVVSSYIRMTRMLQWLISNWINWYYETNRLLIVSIYHQNDYTSVMIRINSSHTPCHAHPIQIKVITSFVMIILFVNYIADKVEDEYKQIHLNQGMWHECMCILVYYVCN